MRLNPFKKKPVRGRGKPVEENDGLLSPRVKKAAFGVVVIVVSLVAILSWVGAAGPTGEVFLVLLKRVFGWMAYVIPLVTIVFGWYMVVPRDESFPRLRMIGLGLLLVGMLGFAHIAGIPVDDALQAADEGRGGGYLGFFLSFPVSRALSRIASGLIFAASALVGFFLFFNLSPSDVRDWFRALALRDEEEVDEDDEDDEEDTEKSVVPRFRINAMRTKDGAVDPHQLKLEQEQAEAERQQKERARAAMKSANRRYKPPSLDLLHVSSGKPNSGDIKENAKKIQRALEQFGIAVTMGEVNVGPTVTQYTLRPEEGVKLSRITALANDLALALAAHPLRIEAPIPGKDLVGIEIPNQEVSLVRLRDLLASKEFKRHESPLAFAIGKNVSGKPVVDSLETMPHILIAGATGSGKSVFVNTLLLSLVYRNSPSLVRLILVDPKRVELSFYNDIPHLMTPVIVDGDKTINALKWAVREMERRYQVLSEMGARNIMSFNANNPDEAMPLIVIVIDELADLMVKHARDVEGAIVRLSQMARAVGIHLVLATQRPSVNVITGLIKANIPARIAFNVASQIDSRTILDMAGAEKLLGNGDMLYLSGTRSKPVRLQGSYVSEDEVRSVADVLREQSDDPDYDETIVEMSVGGGGSALGAGSGEEGDDDPLLQDAKQVAVEAGKVSASLLQRRLRVGYARAARILDMLEEQGVIAPADGNKPRQVLIGLEETEVEVVGEEDVESGESQGQW